MDEDFERITVRYKSYFEVNSDSAEDINLDDIKVDVSSNRKDNSNNQMPNFLALTVLWASFIACQEGILEEASPIPWQQIDQVEQDNAKHIFNQQQWLSFLENILDADWPNWIQDSEKVRERAIAAYQQLDKINDNCSKKINQNNEFITDLKDNIKKKVKEKIGSLRLEAMEVIEENEK